MSSLSPESCRTLLQQTPLLRKDTVALRDHLSRLDRRAKRQQPIDRSLAKWKQSFDRAGNAYQRFQQAVPHLNYPEDLPVSQRRTELVEAITQHPVVIVCGDTGSGKTTQLPKMIFEAGGGLFGRIGVTQPRRLAAMEMARRVAEECGSELGDVVGSHIRFEDRTSPRTRIQFMTDGLLLAQLPSDPDWLSYDTILIDEAHERSLNIDFLLGCLKTLLQRRRDLKVVISSATLDAEHFSDFFSGAPVIRVEGRLYPIEDIFLPPDSKRDLDLPDLVLDALQQTDRSHGPRDTLVFLPGEREIRECARKLEGHYLHQADVLPLYARLSAGEQRRVFTTGTTRRIILATNVAETSLTIPGIRTVIDTGLVRLQRFHPQSRIQRLVTEQISQASAMQRRGRCGRTGPGVYVRLSSEEDMERAPAQTDPEIRRDSLAEVILRMAVMRLPPLGDFPLLDPPKGSQINEGYRTLLEIGAMTEENQLTDRGRRLATFPLDPRLARMLEQGAEENVLPAVLICVAFLSIQDPRQRPVEHAAAADKAHAVWRDVRSDFLSILNLWNALHTEASSRTARNRFCRKAFLHPKRIQEWIRLTDDLADVCREHHWSLPGSLGEMDLRDHDGLHRSLLSGMPQSIGQREEKRDYRAPNGKTFAVFPGSGLADKPPAWIFAFTLLETSRLYARETAAIRPDWIPEIADHLCRYQYERPVWNPERGFVEAEERISLGQLTLSSGRRIHYGRINPEEARDIFVRDALAPGTLSGEDHQLTAYRDLLSTFTRWEQKLRQPGLFDVTDACFDYFAGLIPPEVHSTKTFRAWSQQHTWLPTLAQLSGQSGLSPDDYPDELSVEGVKVTLHYEVAPDDPDRDGVTYCVREQDLPNLPDELLDWVPPGYRDEQLEALFRTLDKPLRLACSPLKETLKDVKAWLEDNNFAYTHSLTKALAAWLAVRLDRIVGARDFDPSRLPTCLKPKLNVIDKQGQSVFRGASFPDKGDVAVTSNSHAPLHKGHLDGLTDWPDHPLDSTKTDQEGRTLWPALTDQSTACGLRFFTDPFQADESHAAGLVRLFSLKHPLPVRHVQKELPLPTSLQLSLTGMPGGQPLEDLVSGILLEALAPDGTLPRSRESFKQACDQARGDLFEVAEKRCRQLEKLFDRRAHIQDQRSDQNLPPETDQDLDLQEQTLWAPGWSRSPERIQRMERWLQGIERRLDRCRQGSDKDLRKQAELNPCIDHLTRTLPHLSPYAIRQAFDKVEELRLSLFAPELGTHEKTSPKRFAKWLESQLKY